MERGTEAHKSLLTTLASISESLPDLDIVIWERRPKSNTYAFYAGTLQNPNIDVTIGECLPSLSHDTGEFIFDKIENLLELPPSAQIVHYNVYKELGWRSGTIFQLMSQRENHSIGVLGFLGKRSRQFGRQELPHLRAMKHLVEYSLRRLLDIDDFIERDRKLENNLFSINTAEVAAQYLHDLKDEITTLVSTLGDLRPYIDLTARPAKLFHSSVITQLGSAQRLSGEFVTQARRNQMARESLDFRALLLSRVSHHRLDAKSKAVGFREFIPERGRFVVKGDVYRLGSVIGNLVSNAVWFVRRGPRPPIVEIVLRSEPSWVIFEVNDNGPGVDDKEKIFKVGYSTRPGGTGLGLPICRDIVHRHDGHIDLDSSPGSGTRFVVRLPSV